MTVYLLHFSAPLGCPETHQARHYIGYTTNVKRRLCEHRKGLKSNIMRVVAERGITFECVRTWQGGRDVERHLKNRKNAKAMCPICNPTGWKNNAKEVHNG